MGLIAMLMGEEPNPLDILLNYKDPGQYGEYATEYVLGKNNIPGYGKTVHNIYLPHKGHTTEVDVLLIHEKGIYVFESKNYSGWIFGRAEQQKWTQCLKNGEKFQFYNPVKQNATHCTAIAEYLGVASMYVISYIVFSQRCELKKVPDDTEQCKIVRRPDLLRVLRGDINSKYTAFTSQQVDAFTQRLQCAANVSKQEKQAHVDAVKERTEGTICPYCGAQLVKRTGKYGLFYGCSSYPKCKFIRNI